MASRKSFGVDHDTWSTLVAALRFGIQQLPWLTSLVFCLTSIGAVLPTLAVWMLVYGGDSNATARWWVAGALGLGLVSAMLTGELRSLGAERSGRLLVHHLSNTLARATRLEDIEDPAVAASLRRVQAGLSHLPGAYNMAWNCVGAMIRPIVVVVFTVLTHIGLLPVLLGGTLLRNRLNQSLPSIAAARRAASASGAQLHTTLHWYTDSGFRRSYVDLYMWPQVAQYAQDTLRTFQADREAEFSVAQTRSRQEARNGLIVTVASVLCLAAFAVSLGGLIDVVPLLLMLPLLAGALAFPVRTLDFFGKVSSPFRELLSLSGRLASSPTHGAPAHNLLSQNVSYAYGQVLVLTDVVLSTTSKSLIVLSGRNGAGKSTYCDVVSGLRMNQGGSVAASPAVDAQAVAMSFQSQQLDGLSVRQVFAYNGGPCDDAAIWQSLRSADMEDLFRGRGIGLDDPLGGSRDLSGGEWQMLNNLAVLSKSATSLYVLDEPLAALDVDRKQTLVSMLAELAKAEGGRRVLMVSHHAEPIPGLPDPVVLNPDTK